MADPEEDPAEEPEMEPEVVDIAPDAPPPSGRKRPREAGGSSSPPACWVRLEEPEDSDSE